MEHHLFINGSWTPSHSGETFHSLDPATEQVLGSFASADTEDVHTAVDAAEHAFPSWSSVPAPKRGAILLRIAQLLRDKKEALARLETQEMGKVLAESRADVQEAIDVFEYMAGEGRRLFGHTAPSELPRKAALTIRRPIGICGLITPWNFPIAIPAWKLATALICGNTVIFKPSSETPWCAVELVKICAEAGVTKGVVNLITGSGQTVGGEIVKHKNIQCLSFTGSRETGTWISANAGLKKTGLELGGKNAMIVMDDADLRLAIDGALWGSFATAGQRCTATSRIIIHDGVADQFTRAFVTRAKQLVIGSGLEPRTDLGPLVSRAALDKVEHYVELGQAEGATLLCGGTRTGMRGFFFEPTIFANVMPDMRIAREEIFGPVVAIMTAKNLDDAVTIANDSEYGLSSAIYTSDITHALTAIERLDAGITYVNAPTIGAEIHLPFGGVKGSGHGREGGILGVDEFSDLKTVYIDYSGRLQKAQTG